LRNGGFERDQGWTIGQYTSLDTQSARTGKRCIRADGARGASIEQTVWAVQPGRVYTVSGWMRTEGVVPQAGGFAFLALYEHDASGRIVRFVDYAKVTGTTGWTEYRHTARLAPTTEYVVVKAGIHSALGTAWFDDLNLVEGSEAQPWTEPQTTTQSRHRYSAAIFDEPGLPVAGARTPTAAILQACAAEGIPARVLSGNGIRDGELNADRFDLLIVPTGATFPVECRKALLAFLMTGGDLLCTGGYAFDNLVVRSGGWVNYRRYLDQAVEQARTTRIPNGGFEDGSAGWTPGSPACTVDNAGVSDSPCGRVTLPSSGESRWERVLDVEPGRAYLIGASARTENVHGSHYAFLAVYQYGEGGKLLEFRDFAQMTGTQGWKRHEARVVIHPAALRVVFQAGLYLAAGTLWFDDVTCAPLPLEERINAHFGDPQDGLVLAPVQLTLFSPDQKLMAEQAVGVWPGWDDLKMKGPFRGYDATAQLRQNARWQPLMEARDRLGRITGAIGALVTHGSGPFTGSRWALFGVTNRDIFAGAQGPMLLRRTLRLLAEDAAASSLTTDFAMYDRGETARITLSLHSPRGMATVQTPVNIVLRLDAPGRSTKVLYGERRAIRSGTPWPVSLNFTWKVPSDAADFIRAQASVTDASGRVVDLIETGFCVRDARIMGSGTRIRYRANAFELQAPGMQPAHTTLFGTDTYGNMFLSPTCSPLTWFADMKAMREHGLHMFENLQYPPTGWKYTEAEWRKMDAMIQLAQRFGLPYMAGLLIGVDVAVDDATLQAQAAMCRSFAERYRHVPGLIYYLNGDFRLDMKDLPDLRRLWNEMLRQRYGSDAALKAAWGPEAVAEPLGAIPVAEYASALPFSERARDTRMFQALLVERWVSALTQAIREVDADHPITSEYYQRPYSGIDLRLSINGMDAANIGYFGPPRQDIAELLATIKWNDMRRAGKTVNLGEFGVKTHDAWTQERDPLGYHAGRTEEEQRRQLWWIVHAALGYEVSKIQNWCWSDDPDSVFPWGVAYNNPLRPKPVLRLWRNLRFVSDLIPQEYARADTVFVMPDSWRLGAPEPAAWRGIATALECLLATNVRFDVVNEAALAGLDARAPSPQLPTAEGDEGAIRPSPLTGEGKGGGEVPRLIVAPFADRMSEGTQRSLRQLAERGATVYVSSPPKSGPLAEIGASMTQEPWSVARVGKGRVVISERAWEAMPDDDAIIQHPELTADPAKNLYLRLVELAGLEPVAHIEAADGVWRAMVRRAGDRTLVSLFQRSDVAAAGAVSVRTASPQRTIRWTAAGRWPCLVILDRNGGVLGATGCGELSVNGKVLVRGTGPWTAASLDGRPLDRSERFVVSATNGGTLNIRNAMGRAVAHIVECDLAGLRPRGAIQMSRTPGGWSVPCEQNDLVEVRRAPGPPR
jgi:hypothetical protein